MSTTSSTLGMRTKTPRLSSWASSRSCVSSRNASRSVLRETPSALPMSCSDSRPPGRKKPSAMRLRSTPATRSAVLLRVTRPRSASRPRDAAVFDDHAHERYPSHRGRSNCHLVELFNNPYVCEARHDESTGQEVPMTATNRYRGPAVRLVPHARQTRPPRVRGRVRRLRPGLVRLPDPAARPGRDHRVLRHLRAAKPACSARRRWSCRPSAGSGPACWPTGSAASARCRSPSRCTRSSPCSAGSRRTSRRC